jgi:hypothetical protein
VSRDPGGSPGRDEEGGPPSGWQLPGDSNQDGALEISDVVSLLLRLFGGAPGSMPCGSSSGAEGGDLALLDGNGDSKVDISDAVNVLRFLFLGGPAPALGTACVPIAGCPDACWP